MILNLVGLPYLLLSLDADLSMIIANGDEHQSNNNMTPIYKEGLFIPLISKSKENVRGEKLRRKLQLQLNNNIVLYY